MEKGDGKYFLGEKKIIEVSTTLPGSKLDTYKALLQRSLVKLRNLLSQNVSGGRILHGPQRPQGEKASWNHSVPKILSLAQEFPRTNTFWRLVEHPGEVPDTS